MAYPAALIDGDSIIYILSWNLRENGDDEFMARAAVDSFVDGVLKSVDAGRYLGALGHEEEKSFRYELAKYKPYKANRRPKDEWVLRLEPIIRDQLLSQWKFIAIPGLEADDVISIASRHFTPSVICSPDKDLRQIPGQHFDYKKAEMAEISERRAEYLFAYQMLVGDATDNVAGLPGIGDKKAKELLGQVDDTMFYESAVIAAYLKYFGNYYGKIIFEENKRVLGLLTESEHDATIKSALVEIERIGLSAD